LTAPFGQQPHQGVACTVKSQGILSELPLHVENPVSGRFGSDGAGWYHVNVFRTHGGAHHEEGFSLSVHDEMDGVPLVDIPGLGKGLGYDHLILTARGEVSPASYEDSVDDRRRAGRKCQKRAAQRLFHPFQFHDHLRGDPVPYFRDARQVFQNAQFGDRHFFEIHPEIGHAALAIVDVPGRLKVLGGPHHTHQTGHPQGHDENDGGEHPSGLP
jgi:hypothetical protein